MEKPTAYIFDLDGTIADCSERLKHIKGPGKKDWKQFFKEIPNDKPIVPTINILHALSSQGYEIIFVTGRPESERESTEKWILNYLGPNLGHFLYMRKHGDFRKDHETKPEIVEDLMRTFNIAAMFDDRPEVIKAIRQLGILVYDVEQGNRDA